MLDSEKYGINVTDVRNILEYTEETKIPGMPDFMLGVINDRGSVLPVIDLRLKFGMSRAEKTIDTCIIVVEISFKDEIAYVGALADGVEEVVELEPENIDPAPRIGTRLRTDFIKGMGKRADEFIILLDIDKVFSDEEINLVEEAAHVAAK